MEISKVQLSLLLVFSISAFTILIFNHKVKSYLKDISIYTQENVTQVIVTTFQTEINVTRTFYQNKYEKWLMIAGDSNMRKTFKLIYRTYSNEIEKNDSSIQKITLSQLETAEDNQWFDKDFIIHFKNNSDIRVSLRFLHGRYWELDRLNKSWTDVRFCNASCTSESVLPSKQEIVFNYNGKPDLLFITRGLWNMNEIKTSYTCWKEEKYSKIIKELNSQVKLVWQNNPKINFHPNIHNWQIKKDVDCQISYAKKHGIAIFNLFEYVSKDMKERMKAKDYHISMNTRNYLFNLMWIKLWED